MAKIGDIEVFTLAEAAARLGVKRNTLVQQVRKGSLHATKTGSSYLVTGEEIDRYEREHRGKHHGFESPDHPLHGKRGGGGRRKKPRDVARDAPEALGTSETLRKAK
jgi:excisionase family DNA binding protein